MFTLGEGQADLYLWLLFVSFCFSFVCFVVIWVFFCVCRGAGVRRELGWGGGGGASLHEVKARQTCISFFYIFFLTTPWQIRISAVVAVLFCCCCCCCCCCFSTS